MRPFVLFAVMAGLIFSAAYAQGNPAVPPTQPAAGAAAAPATGTPAVQPAPGGAAGIQPGTANPAVPPAGAGPATGTPPAAVTAPGGNFLTGLLPILLIFVVFYFLLIMPQQRQRKKQQEMIAALKAGDRVVVLGGIHGVITRLRDATLIVKIAENTEIEVDRASVSYRMGQESK